MSVKAMSWVWEHSASDGNDRLVLLAIADRATDDGRDAWPNQEEISRKTKLARRTVQRCIVSLEQLGELDVQREVGNTNRYRIVFDAEERRANRENQRQIDAGSRNSDQCRSDAGANPLESVVSSTDQRQSDATTSVNLTPRQIDAASAVTPLPASAVAHSTSCTSCTDTVRARVKTPSEQPGARMPLVARGESLAYDQAQQRVHRSCHPEVCRWRDPSVRTCLQVFLVDEFASKLFGVPTSEAVADVIAWARSDAPPAGYVAPGDTLGYWRERWSLTRASPAARPPGARGEPSSGRVIDNAAATDALLARMTNGEALR